MLPNFSIGMLPSARCKWVCLFVFLPSTTEITSGFKLGLIVLAALIILLGIMPNLLLQYLYF